MEVPYASPPKSPIERTCGRFSNIVRPIACFEPPRAGRRAVALLGMPDDTGVRLNNGRPGAKEGPSAIRRVLSKLGVEGPRFPWPVVYDAGDVLPAGDDLDETHRRVSEASAALVRAGLFPIGLGGGHDLTFAFVRGVIEALPQGDKPLAGAYLDPHLDVRETTGSGMPFRRLVEGCGVRSLALAGFDPVANTAAHLDWFLEHGGTLVDIQAPPPEAPFFASLDLDAIDAAHAPGVSAMNPCGLTPRQAIAWARRMAASPRVRCFDVMELSPPNDDRDRTARLAAYLVLSIIECLESQRP
ncbi:MAG: arginase [Phycisphaerales bacterium]|nr:MAG: arginase [Phycisphaerales bacterium]